MEAHLALLHKVEQDLSSRLYRNHELRVKTGMLYDSATLKLLKDHWTNDDHEQLLNQSGIFFSIWIDAKRADKRRARYNIHSKKLRTLAGYQWTSIAFAKRFRERIKAHVSDWPGITLDHGPITLFQGHFSAELDTFENETRSLIDRFVAIHSVIDAVLSEREKQQGSRDI